MTEPRRPALLGLTAYLLVGLTIAITHLLAHGALAVNRIADHIGSPLVDTVRDGTALAFILLCLLVMLPLIVAGTAALMGRHGGRTYQRATGPAAVTTLIGVPLIWVSLAIAALLVALALRQQGHAAALATTTDTLTTSLVQLLIILGPLVGLAAITANRAQGWAISNNAYDPSHIPVEEAEGGPYGGELATDPSAWLDTEEGEGIYPEGMPEDQTPMEDPHAVDPNYLHEQAVDCPRCARNFNVSGHRPLRITCPDCGKTGTIN